MEVNEMDDKIGTQMAVLSDGVLWTPETSRAFRQPPAPVIPGLFDQREAQAVLRQMPIFQAVVTRLNQVLARTGAVRESFEKELRR